MDIQRLTQEVAVSGQIRPRDIPDIRALGFRSIVCNRPDGEDTAQPLFEEIATTAAHSRISAHYLPVPGSGPEMPHVDALLALWPELEKPVLLYCRSGARSTILTRAVLAQLSG